MAVGGFCFALSLGVYSLLLGVGAYYVAAGFVGYACGVVVGYALNRSWTFDARDTARPLAAARYLIVNLMAMLANASFLYLLVDRGGVGEWVAQVVAMLLIAPLTYVANRLWTFQPVPVVE